jgi:ornithine cyclodeaminase
MQILELGAIKKTLEGRDLLPVIEDGFAAYSEGHAVVPPVGELLLSNPPGDVHIKYGYISGGDYYVIKIASGFYENPRLGLPSGNGMMLLFDRRTGVPRCLLLDEGHLTDIRTAVAGAIAAKYLAPREVNRIGIIGSGVQARLQLRYLKGVTSCRDALIWGRTPRNLLLYQEEMSREGFSIETTTDANHVAAACNLIVTTTPATSPLLWNQAIREGTHITAVGSDTAGKQELDPHILQKASLVVADSIPQCLERGEISHAVNEGLLNMEDLVEIGSLVSGRRAGRTDERQITVADLTGVAVQDIQIARAVYEAAKDAGRSSL